ncbi:MAG: helix-turn-helix transcriptional regulator [Candidatus Saccharibacteria bacterium]|nr:helix-turn-helix transcriptional regulator [Candidatus Saccharibacteria bacterium]
MNANAIEQTEGCLSSCLQVLGNKWTALILRDLTDGPKRFTELEKSLETISPRSLSQRLDDLELHKIVTKKHFAESPPRVEYTLTERGRDFLPILKAMADWGAKHA